MSRRRYPGRIRPSRSSALDAEAERDVAYLRRASAKNHAVEERATQRGPLPNSAVQRIVRSRSGEGGEPIAAISGAHLQRNWIADAVNKIEAKNPTAPKRPKQGGGLLKLLQEAIAAMHVVKKGAVGIEVLVLQTQLNSLGASPKLAVDGLFGPKTRRAVVMFQKSNNLAPDGIVGQHTRAAIKAQLNLQATLAALRMAFGSMRELQKRVAALAG